MELDRDFKEFIALLNERQVGYEPLRIDLITTVEGLDFIDCYKRRKSRKADGIKIHLLGLDDLRRNKKLVGRDRDLEDYKHLEKL